MSSPPSTELITIGDSLYVISELTEFGFTAPIELPDDEIQSHGVLTIGETKLDIEFRVRQQVDGESTCSFSNFSIASSETLRRYLKSRDRISSGNEELEARSYDELASGVVASQASSSSAHGATAPGQKSYVKSFALLIMLLAIVGLAILASVFLRSRSSLSVSNSAMVGNWVAVHAKIEGEISEILVREGERVSKGDLLLRLKNPAIAQANLQLKAQLNTAQSKVKALEKQRKAFESKLKYASRKLELDREVANSELEAAEKARMSAKAAFERMKNITSGAVTELEIAEVENKFLEEESNVISKENILRQIDFSKEAAKVNILIIGDRVDDELGRINAELEIAQAEATELAQILDISAGTEGALEVVAPRDGIVFVTYRHEGQFVKVADELFGLSYPGETWAAGQVTAGQASRVLPGQPVKIRIRSMNIFIDGTVMSVGHRAMYSKGNYNAEFRGTTATDVPIKVHIEDLPDGIPSGLRLEMAINTGFGLQWLDDMLGYELKTIGGAVKPEVLDVASTTKSLALKASK